MTNGTRLALSIMIGLMGGGMLTIFALVTVSVILTGSPPDPKLAVILPFVIVPIAALCWRFADGIEHWLGQKKENGDECD